MIHENKNLKIKVRSEQVDVLGIVHHDQACVCHVFVMDLLPSVWNTIQLANGFLLGTNFDSRCLDELEEFIVGVLLLNRVKLTLRHCHTCRHCGWGLHDNNQIL